MCVDRLVVTDSGFQGRELIYSSSFRTKSQHERLRANVYSEIDYLTSTKAPGGRPYMQACVFRFEDSFCSCRAVEGLRLYKARGRDTERISLHFRRPGGGDVTSGSRSAAQGRHIDSAHAHFQLHPALLTAIELKKRLDEIRLLESRKSARLADSDTDFARLADMAGDRRRASATIEVPPHPMHGPLESRVVSVPTVHERCRVRRARVRVRVRARRRSIAKRTSRRAALVTDWMEVSARSTGSSLSQLPTFCDGPRPPNARRRLFAIRRTIRIESAAMPWRCAVCLKIRANASSEEAGPAKRSRNDRNGHQSVAT